MVIAVISLLAAILFPVFGRAREMARRTSCLSNLRTVGMGFLQYTQDYDEKYPDNPNNSAGKVPWTYVIQPYVKDNKVFRCPSDKYTGTWAANISESELTNKSWRKTSYTFNGFFDPLTNTDPEDGGIFHTIAQIKYPSELVMLVEGWESNQQMSFNANRWGNTTRADGTACTGCGNASMKGWDSAKEEPSDVMLYRHMDGANYAFADGHAKWYKWRQLWWRDDSYIEDIGGGKFTTSLKGNFDPRRR